jgi:hypothetical protein
VTLQRVAYVCSSGRSGSTLLDLMLGSHPRFESLGEIDHLPKNLTLNTPCSCGAPARECPFWSRVADVLLKRHGIDLRDDPYRFPLGLFRASRVIDHDHQTPRYLVMRRIVLGAKLLELRHGLRLLPRAMTKVFDRCIVNSIRLYEAVSESCGATCLVDSSKEYRRAVSLYRLDPARVRLLILVRDGRGVFNAMRRSGADRKRSLNFWKRYYEHALPVIQRHVPKEHRMMIRYEDLVARPEATLSAVCAVLGVTYDSRMLQFRDAAKHVLNGNDMRSQKGSALILDERWRTELPPEDLAYFESKGGSLNAALGYS